MRPYLLGALAFAILIALWISQCSGPHAELAGAPAVRPPQQPGGAYQVEVSVRNVGPGHGEIQAIFRLRERATGRIYQVSESAQLERGEVVSLVVEIFAPPGDYEPQVELNYPPG
jgi:hypothetical protein